MKAWTFTDPTKIPPRKRRGQRPIQTDTTPVKVRGEELDPIIWRGTQWAVTTFGIEALDGTYTIGKDRLDERINAHSWLSQMGTKNWVDNDDFATAWLVAIAIHGCNATPEQVHAAIAAAIWYPAEPVTP